MGPRLRGLWTSYCWQWERMGTDTCSPQDPSPNCTPPSRNAKVDVTFGPLMSAAMALEPIVLVRVLGCGGRSKDARSGRYLNALHSSPCFLA
jgi:hypothetical protein